MKVKFGIFADMHVDIMHDGQKRLETFLDSCRKENVDFVIHLGDFCYPDENRKCVCAPEKRPVNIENALKVPTYADKDKIHSMYKNFEKPSYYVLGNHDCDMCSKKQVLDYYGVDFNPYYSFDMGGVHFVALDNNFMKLDGRFVDYENGNYFDESYRPPNDKVLPYMSDEELKWLEENLSKTPYPSVLFSHQAIAGGVANILNSKDVLEVLKSAPNKVLLSINGHEHVDTLNKIDNTWFYNLNSMSCYWLDVDFICEGRFGKEIDEKYPNIKYTAPYKDALFAIISIDDDGATVKGVESEYVGPSPEDLGSKEEWSWCKNINGISPSIMDRYIPFD
ncbi:MAG: metallophosphoesterase [Monoglobales bacterium]